jgi:hypothetical protein
MIERTPCIVPFCTRTTATVRLQARGHDEWICRVHWQAVPATLKRRKFRFERMIRAGREVERAKRLLSATWRRCKVAAIEAAGGIG